MMHVVIWGERKARLIVVLAAALLWNETNAFSFGRTRNRKGQHYHSSSTVASCSLFAVAASLDLINDHNKHTLIDTIHVYDNVFDTKNCRKLHDLAVNHTTRSSDGSSVFWRDGSPSNNNNNNNNKPRNFTPLESAIDSCLLQMGDTTCGMVEYWSRQDYINIDVHSDVDEKELEESGRILCPDWGHVLYLTVVDNGPTCIFNKLGGWTERDTKTELVVVPAVQGRVLRFPGSAMHAVPKPTDRWLLKDWEEQALQEAERDYNKCDTTQKNEGKRSIERSVILFNTWGRQGGPREVEIDPILASSQANKHQWEEWNMTFGKDFTQLHCRPRTEWKEQEVLMEEAPSLTDGPGLDESLRVSLMGQKVRRLHAKKIVRFLIQRGARAALGGASRPILLS